MEEKKNIPAEGETVTPEAPETEPPVTDAPAPDLNTGPAAPQEQDGITPADPGDVVASFDKIEELMAERRAAARAAVEQAEPTAPEAGAPGVEQTVAAPPKQAEEKAAGDKSKEAAAEEQKKPRRGRPPKEEKAEQAPAKSDKAQEAAKPRRGRPPKADKAAPGEAQPPKPRDKVSRSKQAALVKEEAAAGGAAPGAGPAAEAPEQTAPARPIDEGKLVYLKLSELHAFHTLRDHPFQVKDDDKMLFFKAGQADAILKFVNALISNTKGEGKEGDPFWTKAETLLYCALLGYIIFEGAEEDRNMNTLVDMISGMEVKEDDEDFMNAVDYMFAGLEKRKPDCFAVKQYKKYKLSSGVVCFKRLLNQSIGKGGVICSDILLPPHAPKEYADRQTLWNAVEKAERGKTAQLAYSFEISLQNEFSLEENIALARNFLLEQFVSRGMTVDVSFHEKEHEDGGTPKDILKVFLCLDSDTAGSEACTRLAQDIPGQIAVIRLVPARKDWNDVLRQQGDIPSRKFIAETITLRELPTAQPVPMLRMADVELTSMEWLWFPYIPFGKLTIIQGNMLYNAKNGALQIGGTTMDYIRFGTGERILVMLPGLGDGLRSMKGTALPMAFMYREFAKDFTAYAFSRKNVLPEGYTAREMARDQAEAMEQLGIQRADIFGVSMGGMIAQHLAIDFPGKVGKLILTVTSARPNPILTEPIQEWVSCAKRGDHTALMDSNVRRIYSERYYRKNKWMVPIMGKLTKPKSYDRFLIQADACQTHDAYESLHQIQAPTLVIGGEKDLSLGGDASREIAAKIPGAELRMYEQWGHGLYEEAKDFNQVVKDFLIK